MNNDEGAQVTNDSKISEGKKKIPEINQNGEEHSRDLIVFIDQHNFEEEMPTWYACSGLEMEVKEVIDVEIGTSSQNQVYYDYELIHDENLSTIEALRVLEKEMTEYVANKVLICNERRLGNNRDLQSENGIVTVNSSPIDVLDDSVDGCTSSINVPEGFKCTPFKGAMEFFSECDDCDFPTTDVLEAVRESCEKGIAINKKENMQLSYVGDRLNQEPKPISEVKVEGSIVLQETISSRSNNVSMAGGVIGAFVVIALAAFLVIKRRRERLKAWRTGKNGEIIESSSESKHTTDLNGYTIRVRDGSTHSYREGIEIEFDSDYL